MQENPLVTIEVMRVKSLKEGIDRECLFSYVSSE